jgi:acetyltransferase-like isoleucine patch superfamily enzyme
MSIAKTEIRCRNILNRLRGKFLKAYLCLHGCKVGKNLKCKGFPIIRTVPQGNMTLGDDVTIGFNISFDIHEEGNLVVGDRVNLTQNILLNSRSKIVIGEHCLIAENVSIRDGDHSLLGTEPISSQPCVSEPIYIGRDVWIGTFTVVLRGARIPDGAIIGANSLVLRKSKIRPYSINAGSPVKEISMRTERGRE